MFWKKRFKEIDENKNNSVNTEQSAAITINELKHILANMSDAEIVEHKTNSAQNYTLAYIKTLIDMERLNESIIVPLNRCSFEKLKECISASKVAEIRTIDDAQTHLLTGSVLLWDSIHNEWLAVRLENPLSRGIEPSDTETILYGPKDSFSEQIELNMTMIRRRLPVTSLKSEIFSVGSLSKTTVVMMYLEDIANPEFISIARKKIMEVDFDLILEASNLAAFIEDHTHSIFPQHQLTDRPDMSAYSLGLGKIVILVNNTPFVLIAPITFFHLFQSPDDYIHRWIVASFLRSIRYLSYILSLMLIPLYVALTNYHYQMIPLQTLFVVLETRSELPFSPFWESLLMLITLEIIKEASLRMPTKTGQTLGVIGGIVIGEATVAAGFASQVLIVLVGISAIASFLVPNYLMNKTNTIIQFLFLLLASMLGYLGIVFGMIIVLAHLNKLTSLKQPYLAPVAPFYWRDWKDLFIRAPLPWMKTRFIHLKPLHKWRISKRR